MMLPAVLNLEGPVVIFGGGKVGARKIDLVSKFTEDITVITRESRPMPDHVRVVISEIEPGRSGEHVPDNASLVIAALSDNDLNEEIANWCRTRGIPVNVVDEVDLSTVLFPALSKRGDLNIAISTSGRCPFLAKKIREETDGTVAERGRWLEVLAPLRAELTGDERKKEILDLVFGDPEIGKSVKEGDTERARRLARGVYKEVYDVHS